MEWSFRPNLRFINHLLSLFFSARVRPRGNISSSMICSAASVSIVTLFSTHPSFTSVIFLEFWSLVTRHTQHRCLTRSFSSLRFICWSLPVTVQFDIFSIIAPYLKFLIFVCCPICLFTSQPDYLVWFFVRLFDSTLQFVLHIHKYNIPLLPLFPPFSFPLPPFLAIALLSKVLPSSICVFVTLATSFIPVVTFFLNSISPLPVPLHSACNVKSTIRWSPSPLDLSTSSFTDLPISVGALVYHLSWPWPSVLSVTL